MTINRHADHPVYRQLADLLRDQIHSGQYPYGTTLPSESQLARQYGLGREAVRQAIGMLRHEGLVSTSRGRGSTVRKVLRRVFVTLNAGDRVTARMPSANERHAMALDDGVPIIEIRRNTGSVERLPGDRAEVGPIPRARSASGY